MSGEEQLFNNVTKQDLGSVTFGDNSKARAVGIGSVDFAGTMQVEQVLFIDGLKHNLLSISQLCDERNIVTFEYDKCIIRSPEFKKTRFVDQRHKNMYVLQLKNVHIFVALSNEPSFLSLWTLDDAFIMLEYDNISFIT